MRLHQNTPPPLISGKRFVVLADWGNGLVTVYQGNNAERAQEVARFWDERVPVRFFSRRHATTNDKWDALFWDITNNPEYGKQPSRFLDRKATS